MVTATAFGLGGCVSLPEWRREPTSEPTPTSWEMAGGNAHNTSRLTTTAGSQIGDAAWRRSPGSQFASPLVTTTELGLVHTQSTVFGFDKADGTVAFTHSLPGGVAAAPAVTDSLVVVPRDTVGEGFDQIDLDTPTVYAIDHETGRRAWEHTVDGSFLASVTVADDIYVQSDREVHRLTANGTAVWRHSFEQPFDLQKIVSYIRPVVGSDAVYVVHRGGVIRLDRATGEVQWTRSAWEADFPPVVVDETTLLASTGDAVVGVHPDDGRVRWRVDESPAWGPAVTDAVAVFDIDDGGLLGVDPAAGEEQWRTEDGHTICPPVVASGSVFTGGTTLSAVDTATGDRVDTRDVRTSVNWITPDADGLLVRESTPGGPTIKRYSLR